MKNETPALADVPPERMQGIRALILDVDGVLTDGKIIYTDQGHEAKSFHCRDGAGIKFWHQAGHVSAILTGRTSVILLRRAKELGISEVVMGAEDKKTVLAGLLEKLGVQPQEAAYVGDDLPDIPVFGVVGFSVAVADAVQEAKDSADAVTLASGGRGAVREVVEAVLRARGEWAGIVRRVCP